MSLAPGGDPAIEAAAADRGDVAEGVVAGTPMRRDIWRRFCRNRLALVGLGFLGLLVLAAILAPLVTFHDPTKIVAAGNERQGPTTAHWFGTTEIGRDMYSRIIYGARVSLKVGVLAMSISLVIGVTLGALAGYLGGLVESLIMRVTDVFLAIPYVVLAIAIATVFGRSESSIIVVLGLTGWLAVCRIVRASFLQLKEMEYVEAARALGYGRARIMFRHLLPNALQPIIVYGTIGVGNVILAETALSFLGVGAQDPTPSWGLMISTAQGQFAAAPHLLFFPGGAIVLTVLAFVFVGDGLRDALDPKLK